MVVEIELSKRNGSKYKGMYVAIVDDCDADLADFSWNVESKKGKTVYAKRTDENGNHVYMHRIILGRMLPNGLERHELVDHVNRNGVDNQRKNLRKATKAQNMGNTGLNPNNTSGARGVGYAANRGKFRAQITINHKQVFLGYHDTFDDAKAAYNKKGREYFGEFWNEDI